MKNWRRTASTGSLPTQLPPLGDDVVSVTVDSGGSSVTVVFRQATTWDGAGAGTLNTGTPGTGTWTNQVNPTTLQWSPDGAAFPGDAWSWSGPDASLTPVPDPTQTGVAS